MVLPCHQINIKETPAVVAYKDRTASDQPDYKAAFLKEFFRTLFLTNNSPFDDLIDDLVHSDLILKIFTTKDKVGDILFNSTSTEQTMSMTSPYVFLKSVPRSCSICRFAWAKFSCANITPVFKASAMENVETIDIFPCYKILGKRQERIVYRAISRMYHLFSLKNSMAS